MANIFNKKQIVKIDLPDGNKIISQELSVELRQELEKNSVVLRFPYAQFEKYLRGNKDIIKLEDNLKNLFFENLPHKTICKDCPKHENPKVEQHEHNCAKAWLEYQTLYLIAGNNMVAIIEANKKVLRKEVKQKLAELFYIKAFEFNDANSFFKVGEMVKFLLKEGLKEISNQLKQMELKTAQTIAYQIYHAVNEKIILSELGEPGFEDFLKTEKKFWKNKKNEFNTKQKTTMSKTNKKYSEVVKTANEALFGTNTFKKKLTNNAHTPMDENQAITSLLKESSKEYIQRYSHRLSEFTSELEATEVDFLDSELEYWEKTLLDIQNSESSHDGHTYTGINNFLAAYDVVMKYGYEKFMYSTKRKMEFLENKKMKLNPAKEPISTNASFIPNDENLKDWIYANAISKFKETEEELYNREYLDTSYKWQKQKTKLIDFIHVIISYNYFKPIVKGKKTQDFHKRQFISQRYGFGKTGLTETAKKYKPELKIALIPFYWISKLS